MARPKTPKGQSSPTEPTPIHSDVVDVAADTPETRLVSFSRQGVSIRLPEMFWQRAVLFVIAVCCYAGGYILLEIATGGFSDDEDGE